MPAMDMHSLVASIRFGLGARPDQPLPGDPVAWLRAQIRAPAPALPLPQSWERMPTATDGLTIWRQDGLTPPAAGRPSLQGVLYRQEVEALMRHMLATHMPFRERLTMFWSNHLTVSVREGSVRGLAGDYLRSAIRPHVNGCFGDMLLAATRHPAMLFYLNQNSSIGPASPLGQRQKRGLNENLAREILELHTLSPTAGYTQADVTALAALLTGLTVERYREPIGSRFVAEAHEPGAQKVFGRTFEPGPGQTEAALRWLAGHEATHRHLALKLARHFVADTPQPATVERLFGVLRDSRGDLAMVAEAIVELPEAWEQPLGKLRTPQDFVVASLRAVNAGPEFAGLGVNSMANLGQTLWSAPAPIGWPDRAEDWLHPEGLMQRMETAYGLAGRFARLNPNEIVETALGPLARPETVQAVRRAGSPRDGLTLLLASPEFQRR